jgi:hypothetical protein
MRGHSISDTRIPFNSLADNIVVETFQRREFFKLFAIIGPVRQNYRPGQITNNNVMSGIRT